MRILIGLIAGAAIASAVIQPATTPLAPVALAQTGPPTTVDPRYTTYSWEAPTERADGSPLGTVAGYTVAYWPAGSDPVEATPVGTLGVIGTVTTLAGLVDETTANGEYQVSVRAVDPDGLVSAWSAPIVQTWIIERQPPKPVTLWRVTIVGRSDGTIVWEEAK